jgi:hypothetical protein
MKELYALMAEVVNLHDVARGIQDNDPVRARNIRLLADRLNEICEELKRLL